MKVANSLRSLKTRHRDCQVVRRKGRVYVINKTQKRYKAPPGLKRKRDRITWTGRLGKPRRPFCFTEPRHAPESRLPPDPGRAQPGLRAGPWLRHTDPERPEGRWRRISRSFCPRRATVWICTLPARIRSPARPCPRPPCSRSRGPTDTSRPTGTASRIRSRPGTMSPSTCAAPAPTSARGAARPCRCALGPIRGRLLPKAPWVSSKMSEGVMERMMRMILPFRMEVTAVDGTWKLNQNKPEAARLGAAAALEGCLPNRPPAPSPG